MLARQSTNLRKLLFYPLLNSFVVLLKSSPKRFLRTKPHLVQQPTYRCFAEADAVLAPNQLPIIIAVHSAKGNFICLGSCMVIYHKSIAASWQSVLAAGRRRTSIQGVPTSSAMPSQPAEQSRSLHSKHLRHYHYWLPVLDGGYSPFSQFCEFIICKLSSIVLSHTCIITSESEKSRLL